MANEKVVQPSQLLPQPPEPETACSRDILSDSFTPMPAIRDEDIPPPSRSSPLQEDESLKPKEDYRQMWQRYSQDVQASNPVKLDLRVGRRALADGQHWKDIALMLVVGSPQVMQIHQEQGKDKARAYVNQVVKAVCQSQQQNLMNQQQRQRQHRQQLEL
jgi:hypothetical protein